MRKSGRVHFYNLGEVKKQQSPVVVMVHYKTGKVEEAEVEALVMLKKQSQSDTVDTTASKKLPTSKNLWLEIAESTPLKNIHCEVLVVLKATPNVDRLPHQHLPACKK